MGSITAPVVAATVGGIGSAASGIIGAGASSSAASAQEQAATTAANAQLSMFNEQEKNLEPFMQAGQGGLNAILDMMGLGAGGGGFSSSALGTNAPLPSGGTLPSGGAVPNALVPTATPFQPTMAQLSQTPGYQFTLQQGEQAVQNQYSAQGLGLSGAAMKAGANYAAGLASTTYQQQFNNYQTQYENQIQQFSNTLGLGQTQFSDLLNQGQTQFSDLLNQGQTQFGDTLAQQLQHYNMLGGLTNLGESASAMVANMGMQAQTSANNYLTSGAAAVAAGQVGSANAAIGGINGLGGAVQNYAYMSQMFPSSGANMFGTSGSGGGASGSFNYGNV